MLICFANDRLKPQLYDHFHPKAHGGMSYPGFLFCEIERTPLP